MGDTREKIQGSQGGWSNHDNIPGTMLSMCAFVLSADMGDTRVAFDRQMFTQRNYRELN